MAKPKQLSLTQFNWLLDRARGIDPTERLHGRSQRGGATATEGSLIRRGLLDAKTKQVTAEGHKAMEASEDRSVNWLLDVARGVDPTEHGRSQRGKPVKVKARQRKAVGFISIMQSGMTIRVCGVERRLPDVNISTDILEGETLEEALRPLNREQLEGKKT